MLTNAHRPAFPISRCALPSLLSAFLLLRQRAPSIQQIGLFHNDTRAEGPLAAGA